MVASKTAVMARTGPAWALALSFSWARPTSGPVAPTVSAGRTGAGIAATAPSRAAQVPGPTTPSGSSPTWRWNSRTRRLVVGPNWPSVVTGPWAASACPSLSCMVWTSGPWSPWRSVGWAAPGGATWRWSAGPGSPARATRRTAAALPAVRWTFRSRPESSGASSGSPASGKGRDGGGRLRGQRGGRSRGDREPPSVRRANRFRPRGCVTVHPASLARPRVAGNRLTGQSSGRLFLPDRAAGQWVSGHAPSHHGPSRHRAVGQTAGGRTGRWHISAGARQRRIVEQAAAAPSVIDGRAWRRTVGRTDQLSPVTALSQVGVGQGCAPRFGRPSDAQESRPGALGTPSDRIACAGPAFVPARPSRDQVAERRRRPGPPRPWPAATPGPPRPWPAATLSPPDSTPEPRAMAVRIGLRP